MMPQHDAPAETLAESAALIVGRIIDHQRAGVDPHAPILLDHHLAVRAHDLAPRGFGVIAPHAVLRYAAARAAGNATMFRSCGSWCAHINRRLSRLDRAADGAGREPRRGRGRLPAVDVRA